MASFDITLFIENRTLDDVEELCCRVFDDGTPIQLSDGTLFVEIMREEETHVHALLSVAEDALRHIEELCRVRFSASEVVPVSAIAKELGLSRDTVYKHARGERGGGFPAPVSINGITIYSLVETRRYFADRGLCDPPNESAEVEAVVAMVQPVLNLAADWAVLGDVSATEDVVELFAKVRARALAG